MDEPQGIRTRPLQPSRPSLLRRFPSLTDGDDGEQQARTPPGNAPQSPRQGERVETGTLQNLENQDPQSPWPPVDFKALFIRTGKNRRITEKDKKEINKFIDFLRTQKSKNPTTAPSNVPAAPEES